MSQPEEDAIRAGEGDFPRAARSGCAGFLGAVISGPLTLIAWMVIDGFGTGELDLAGFMFAVPFSLAFSFVLVLLPSLAGTYAMMWLARDGEDFRSLWAWLAFGLLYGGVAAIIFDGSIFDEEMQWAMLVAGAVTGLILRAVAQPWRMDAKERTDA